VIVAYGNQIAMEPTLEQSLARIFSGRTAPPGAEGAAARPQETPGGPPPALTALAQRALEVFARAQEALRRGDWAGYGAEQKELEAVLRALSAGKR
jgi:uncharacterized protein